MLRFRCFRSSCVLCALASLPVVGSVAPVFAANWTGAVSNLYSDNANWDSPPSGGLVHIDGGPNLPVVVGVADVVGTTQIGTNFGDSGSVMITTGGYLQVAGLFVVGSGGTGVVTQDGGYLTAATLDLADGGASTGTYTLTGGTIFSLGSAYIGTRGTATLNVQGGDVIFGHPAYSGGTLYLGGVAPDAAAVTSTINQTAGVFNVTNLLLAVSIGNHSATGVYNLDGGTFNLGTDITNGAGTSYLNINGGTLQLDEVGLSIDVDNLEIGTKPGATASYTQTSEDNASLVAGLLSLGSATSTGQLNIEGGTVQVGDLAFAGSTSKILLKPTMALNVLQANYSEADGLADAAAGFVGSTPGGAIVVQTVDIGGVNYTQLFSDVTAIPGDFNADGMVDAADLAQWQGDFGVDGGSDANLDGESDGADFLIWQQNFGAPAVAAASHAVPEPTALALSCLAYAASWGLATRRAHGSWRRYVLPNARTADGPGSIPRRTSDYYREQ